MRTTSGWSHTTSIALTAVWVALALGCSAEAKERAAPPERDLASDAAADLPATRTEGPADAAKRTVLVELFTSEGCSSCPPADRLLADLADDEALDVVAVAFHVDYWDDLGWKDRFSQRRWSTRQRDYARAHGSRRVYTPQLLFDGRDRGVGRSPTAARAAIAEAERAPTSLRLEVDVEPGSNRGRIAATVRTTGAGVSGAVGDRLMVGLVEAQAATNVPAGENAGRRLEHAAIALDLVEACTLGQGAGQRCDARLEADGGEGGRGSANLAIVVFVQDPATMRVMQAVRVPVPPG